jgi:hypothetical protein
MSNLNLLASSEAMFHKLLEDYDLFNNDSLSASKALNFAATAWHLTDWVYPEFENAAYANLGAMREAFFASCKELRIMHDLATGLKHFTVSRPKSDMSGSHMHEGPFGKQFSKQFDVSYLAIDFANGDSEAINSIFDKVLAFWKAYFQDKAIHS